MATPLKVPFKSHFDFRGLPDVRVLESFALGEFVCAGVQRGIWQYDEFYWSERLGAWGGVEMPALEVVSNLSLYGAALETFVGEDASEPLLRVAVGQALVGTGEILYRSQLKYAPVPDHPTEYRLYSSTTGALVASAGESGALGVVPNGSYVLWARVFGGLQFQTGQGLAHFKDGEWSAVRVCVGNGAWMQGVEALPSPGAALYKKLGAGAELVLTPANEAGARVVFDPLARCVSAAFVLEQDIRKRDGTFLVPAGTLLIGGLRSSRNGPQTALWALHTDGTARILGLQANLSNGACECGKTNHHASDIVQSSDAALFVLSECALFRFDPDALRVDEALPGYPRSNALGEEDGHPGGNCLRCPSSGEMIHWTEDLTGRKKGETYFYNRIVRRVNGKDGLGPSTLWHGTNCAEMYLGRYFAVRGERTSDPDEAALEGTLYLDWLDGGQWHGYANMACDINGTFWQRLRAANGSLYVFGFKPLHPLGTETGHGTATPLEDENGEPLAQAPIPPAGAHALGDVPVCAIADGKTLRDAQFPFLVRRATVLSDDSGGDARLFVAARGGSESIGIANRVVEILPQSAQKICALWNPVAHAFRFSRAAFLALGGDPDKLPAYFAWTPTAGKSAGGVWRPSTIWPTSGYFLTLDTSLSTLIGYVAGANGLPYDPSVWDTICFEILSDGSLDTESGAEPSTSCTSAECALERMPPGTRFRALVRGVSSGASPITSIQLTDTSEEGRLGDDAQAFASLWGRVDSSAPLQDLSSYTQRLSFSRLTTLRRAAKESVEVVVLIPPSSQPVKIDELPALQRRT